MKSFLTMKTRLTMKSSVQPLLVASGLGAAALLLAAPALAHHPMAFLKMQPGPLAGIVSGLMHPVLGPDHLLFLLAIGLVVDDSIVVTENIARHLRMGLDRTTAAIQATRQISLAVIGCTATLMLASV